MLKKILKLSINNKFIVILATLALIVWGVFSMINLPIDAVPDITNNQVQIVTISPSLAAQEVEQFITYPIEMEMANVQDVDEIRSISRYGLSVVTVVFSENTPVLDARQLVGQQLDIARQQIPEGYGEPSLMPITTGLGEIYQYTIDVKDDYDGTYSPTELRTIHDWVVKRQLNGIPGIVEISSFGGFLKEYEVAVSPRRLSNYNFTLLDVNKALQSNNQNTGGSYIQKGPYAYYVRADGLITSINDIEEIVVGIRNNVAVQIRDIAKVKFGSPPRFGAMTKDGKGEAVGGITLMLKGGNASQVIGEVKERITQIEKNLPKGLEINPYLDRAILVKKVINTVGTNLVEGGLIVIFILVLLLGNFRAGLIVASVIPLSMLFAFGMMRVFGVTASVMSLGAIDFGLIVDATVIIVEGIIFQIERQKKKLSSSEMSSLVFETVDKLKTSAAFGAIIILIVYFPILALSGIEGKMFKPMAFTVIFAIIGALLLSFTYVPVVSALFLSKKISHKVSIADRLMKLIYQSYKPVFELALRYKKSVLALSVAVFVASLFIFNTLGAEFLPDLDEGDLAMQMTVPPGSSLNESIKTSTKAEKILLEKFPEVLTVVSKIGTAEVPTDPMAIEDADIMIILKPKSEWVSASNREELADKMKEELQIIAGASFEFTQPIQLRFNELLTGAKSDIVIKIYGEDLKLLYKKANEVRSIIEGTDGAADIKVEQIEGLPQLVIKYNRNRIARHGLNIEEINTMIRTAMAGEKVGVVFEGERKFDLVVRLEEEYRTNFKEFYSFYLKTPNGTQIPLSEVASMEFIDNPTQVSRDNTHRRISVGINVRNRDVQSLVEEIQEKLDNKLELPSGYYVSYGGKFENLQSAISRLKIVVPIALALIFILLYFAFSSLSQALLIFMTIPLSIIGGIFSLWIRGLPFSISAGIGFIALFGVAVLDGIVLLNNLNELKKQGVGDVNDRIRQATKNRLRPVIITSAVASLGFLPMALSLSTGAEVQRPLATVVIGGIITSTFLTMIVLPLVYFYFETKFKAISLPKKALTVILLVFSFLGLNAQKEYEVPRINENSYIEMALSNNPQLKNAALQIQKSAYEKQSTLDFGNTEFNYLGGQINSEFIDYSFTLRQDFGNPFKNIALSKVYGLEKEYKQFEYLLVKNQIIYFVKLNYQYWQLQKLKIEELDTLIQGFEKLIEMSELQQFSGESNMLSTLSVRNRYNRYIQMSRDLESELLSAQQKLQSLIFCDTIYIPEEESPKKLQLLINIDELDSLVSMSPALMASQTNVLIQEQNLSVERSEILPNIYAGYFNQQIDGNKGFQGWEAGVSFPLIFFSKNRKNQSVKINMEIAQNENDYLYQNTLFSIKTKLEKHKKFLSDLDYFESIARPINQKAFEQTRVLFNNGDISYFELLQSVENIVQTELEYIDKMFEYNENVLNINQLIMNP